MQSYEKDSSHKFKKEKEIDKYLHQVEKTRVIELKQQVKHLEKIVDIKLANKRERSDTSNAENNQNIESSQNKDPIKMSTILNETQDTPPKEIDIKFATEKILKHIEKPGALNKCLNLLKSLLMNIDKVNPLILIKIFYKISILPFKFNEEETTKNITQLYEYVNKELIRLGEQEKEKEIEERKYILEKEFLEFFSIFKIPFEEQISLITDDSFKFNNSIKKLDKEYTSIEDYRSDEIEIVEKFEKYFNKIKTPEIDEDLIKGIDIDIYNQRTTSLTDFLDSIDIHVSDISTLKSAIKRNFLFDCIKKAFNYYKLKWAYTSINSLFTKLYLEKSKLSPDQLDQLSSMINIIKNKSSNISILDSSRSFRDEKIKSNPLEAYHQVTDARAEKIVDSGLDKWTAKQSGLSEGKMYINN
jgi:hypothetical protein